MTLILPNPNSPANGDPLNATPIFQNQQAIVNSIQSFDASQIAAGTLSSPSAFSTALNPQTRFSESFGDFIAQGCLWNPVSGFQGTMSAGIVYINGIRVLVNGVTSYTFTASNDVYVSVDYNGNISYNGVANNGTPPSLPANSVWLGIVVTNGTGIGSIINDIRPRHYSAAIPNTTAVLSSNSALVSITKYYFKANHLYLIVGQAQQTSPSTTGSVWDVAIRVNGSAIADQRHEYNIQQGTNMVIPYLTGTDAIVSVDMYASRLSGTSNLTIEYPMLWVMPMTGLGQ